MINENKARRIFAENGYDYNLARALFALEYQKAQEVKKDADMS